MHPDVPPAASDGSHVPLNQPWYRLLNRSHWFVLIVAALGWLFDTMDQQLFTLARIPAMRDLLEKGAGGLVDGDQAKIYGAYATSIFIIGWATGGLIFGVLGDRYGRARVMAWTILIYSMFTGLTAFSTSFWDFAVYRFLTGLGVGGEFAVGVALVAEVMPAKARPYALGLVQALSAVGNIAAGIISIIFGSLEQSQVLGNGWRWMFLVGALPAILVLIIRRHLKEPETWQRASEAQKASKAPTLGSYSALFDHPTWRRNAIVGLALASVGVVGLWGIGFFTVDLFDSVLRTRYADSDLSTDQIDGRVAVWKGIVSMMMNVGAFFGIYCFAPVSQKIGRRPAFAMAFVAAGLTTAMVFAFLDSFTQVFWMVPLMGFCQLALFGGYAIYFPELFPTSLRSTGTSFCYNVGRFIAAAGPFALGQLMSKAFGNYDGVTQLRYAGMTMCSVFAIGLIALMFAPETKDQPLPE